MRAVQLIATGAPLEERALPLPTPAAGEVLVEVRAAGICHSDVHYRAGAPRPKMLPRTLGHEIAGVVSAVGPGVASLQPGARVAVNYVLHCGDCTHCRAGRENYCALVGMIGSSRDGGYADHVLVPARNALPIPDTLPFERAAIMMCSTATAFHALRVAALAPRESLCVLGFGGLGLSAAALAPVLFAGAVIVVDTVADKLAAARAMGARTVEPGPLLSEHIRQAADGRGVDVVLDFVGHAATTHAALGALAHGGRLVSVALSRETLPIDPYLDLIAREVRILGCNDHLASELRELVDLAGRGALDLSRAVTRTIPLSAAAINVVFDEIEARTSHFRTVIVPGPA
ncbi:MAG: alcohol dehydrogenase catalytic domain-containing protein [bacterium]